MDYMRMTSGQMNICGFIVKQHMELSDISCSECSYVTGWNGTQWLTGYWSCSVCKLSNFLKGQLNDQIVFTVSQEEKILKLIKTPNSGQHQGERR